MNSLWTQVRLLICCWLFEVVLHIAPKDSDEGMLIIANLHEWATAAVKTSTIKLKGEG